LDIFALDLFSRENVQIPVSKEISARAGILVAYTGSLNV